MKTIREICELKKIEQVRCGGDAISWIIAALEAREKERDEAERKRVKAAISEAFATKFNVPKQSYLLDEIYQPPAPEKLPAGYWWMRHKTAPNWVCCYKPEDFPPQIEQEYRRGDDPPPEVTGKQEGKS